MKKITFLVLLLLVSCVSIKRHLLLQEKTYYVHMWAKRDTVCKVINDVVFYNSLECLGKQTRFLMFTDTFVSRERPDFAPASLRVNAIIHVGWNWQWDLKVPYSWEGASNCIEDIWVAPDVSDKNLGHEIYHLIDCYFH